MDIWFWVLGVPAVAAIALAAVIGASWGRARDRATPQTPPGDHKPRPAVSRVLSTLFVIAMLSALILAAYRRDIELYPVEAGIFLSLFVLGGAAGIVNRRVYGFWI